MENKIHVFRLKCNQDLLGGILDYCQQHNIKAGTLVSAVGCIFKAVFRKADGKTIHSEDNNFEVVSLTGTISEDGPHIHISLCDNNLRTIGGHLIKGSLVNTTMEIVLLEINDYKLTRSFDKDTGYNELDVKKLWQKR